MLSRLVGRVAQARSVAAAGQSRGLAAWHPKWKQKAPRKKDKKKSDDQVYMEKLRDQALYRDSKAQQKRAKRQGQGAAVVIAGDALSASLSASSSTPEQPFIPPALLLPTGSPHVFISKSAAQEANLDPRALFGEADYSAAPRPPLFRTKTFVYAGVERLDDTASAAVQYREAHVPKVAFLGRSNVGKSSLVNALMRRDLARCSKQPGRTQQAHRFALVDHKKASSSDSHNNAAMGTCAGIFLDLPGYGYAVAPDDVLADWQRRTQQVLRQTHREGNLRRVYWLVDARLGLTAVDHSVGTWLQETAQLPHTLVWTKVDSVAKPQLIKGINDACMWYQKQVFVAEQAGEPCWLSPVIHATSTKGNGGQGLNEVLAAIETEFLVEDGEDY
jgi:GTP-binding protein